MPIEVICITNAGTLKKINQDAVLINDRVIQTGDSGLCNFQIIGKRAILAISDGVGSSPKPDIASRLTLEYLSDAFAAASTFLPIKTIKQIQEKLSIYANKDKCFKNSCCTLAGIVFENQKVKIFNVGDSRVYKIQNNKITQLSYDHTVLNRYIREGVVEENGTKVYADNYKMLDSCIIANFDADDFEIYTSEWLECKNGDAYMICSDGLSDLLDDGKISDVINLSDICESVKELFEGAMRAGGHDNISIILCKVNTNS